MSTCPHCPHENPLAQLAPFDLEGNFIVFFHNRVFILK